MNATLSAAGGDPFCELTTLSQVPVSGTQKAHSVLAEIYGIVTSLTPSRGPSREMEQEGG